MSDNTRVDQAFRLDGQVAIVTGGGTGLGYGIAGCIAAAGASVVIVGRREGVLREACSQLDDSVSYVVADITDPDSPSTIVAETVERHGTVSILVNNAGVHLKKPLEETSNEEFEHVMRTHLTAAFALSREVTPVMDAAGGGHIVLIGSASSFIGMPNIVSYTAAKTAYNGVARSLTAELATKKIRVNCIVPGWIESQMLRQALAGDPDRERRILQRIPGGEFGDPKDIGLAAVYLSSPAGRYVSGVVFPVDGGATGAF